MLRLSMFFLVCALCGGVFGFGGGAAPSWLIARGMFFVCFAVAMVSLVYGTVAKPHAWQTLDVTQRVNFG